MVQGQLFAADIVEAVETWALLSYTCSGDFR